MYGESDRELDRLEKTMTLEEGLLELEKRENAAELQFGLIARMRPGFEEYLIGQFFSPRCIKCPLNELKENGCREGSTFCVYDEEFLRFQIEYVKKLVQKLKNGERDVQELKIPEKYVNLKNKLQLAIGDK